MLILIMATVVHFLLIILLGYIGARIACHIKYFIFKVTGLDFMCYTDRFWKKMVPESYNPEKLRYIQKRILTLTKIDRLTNTPEEDLFDINVYIKL